jgi:protein-tyrosine phosphatase
VSAEVERRIGLNGTRNLRDLGGYATANGRRTRWKTLYRSDCLDRVDSAGQALLVEAGLRSIFDLRDDSEVAARPNVFVGSAQVAYRRLPLFDGPLPEGEVPAIADGYLRELDDRGQQLTAVVEAVLAPGALPGLIHCSGGKDRTGLVIGLVLHAVEVPDATIAEDYALSTVCLGPEYLEEQRRAVAERGLDWARWGMAFDAPPERMLKTLDYLVQKYGGGAAYLARYGITSEQIARLRELLTEPA